MAIAPLHAGGYIIVSNRSGKPGYALVTKLQLDAIIDNPPYDVCIKK